MLTEAQLREIEAAEQAATPGEWVARGTKIESVAADKDDLPLMEIYEEGGHSKKDALFIAGARTWVPQLLAMVREQRETIVALDRMLREQR